MEIISPKHHGWVVVPVADLVEFLKTCNDYTREGYCGATRYRYRHNCELFAAVVRENGHEVAYAPPVNTP